MLKALRLVFFVCVCFIFSWLPNVVKGQGSTNEIFIDSLTSKSNAMQFLLDTVIKSDRKCADSTKWYWIITFTKIKKRYKFLITRHSSICRTSTAGFFRYKNELFFVGGDLPKNLFLLTDKQKMIICPKKNNQLIDVEDYSTWYFIYRDGKFTSKRSYVIKC